MTAQFWWTKNQSEDGGQNTSRVCMSTLGEKKGSNKKADERTEEQDWCSQATHGEGENKQSY